MGFQGAALVLAPTVLNVVVAVRASGLDDKHLTWSVFAAMLICAAITALQAFQLRRFGAGHIALAWPAAMFIAIMVAAVSKAGPATFASLLVVCSLLQVALAWWLPTLRRIVTPVVSGAATMLIAVSVLPIAFDSVRDLPAGTPAIAGPAIAGITLLASVIMALSAGGHWQVSPRGAGGPHNWPGVNAGNRQPDRMDDHTSAARALGPVSGGAQRPAASPSDLSPSLVLLFGSAARGEQSPGPDLDLCPVFGGPGGWP